VPSNKTQNSMRSLIRAISVIKSFSPNEVELTGADIARKVGLPKTTVYRILKYLTEGKLLEQRADTGKYTIGTTLYVLGSLYLSTTNILKAAEPVMETLNDLSSETVNLSIFDKGYAILIMRKEARYAFRWAVHIGSVLPAYASSMGKALLSELAETEIDRFYPNERLTPLTKNTIATKTELKLELQKIRKCGLSFAMQETFEGIDGIASAIKNVRGEVSGALGMAVPIFRMNQANRDRLAGLVRVGASLISYRLGYEDAVTPVHDIQEIRSWWEQNQPDSASEAELIYLEGR